MKKPTPKTTAKAKSSSKVGRVAPNAPSGAASAKAQPAAKAAKGAKGSASVSRATRPTKKPAPTPAQMAKLASGSKAKQASGPKAKPAPAPKPARKARPASPLVAALVAAFAEKKVEDVRVLDVSELSTITDFLVIGTGNSETHLRALRIEADRVLKEFGTHIIGRDSQLESGWTVVDAFDVMVHLLTAEKREYYRLEHLWRDADEIPIEEILRK